MINRLWMMLWGQAPKTNGCSLSLTKALMSAEEKIALIRCVDDRYFDCRHKDLPRAFDFTCAGSSLWFVSDEGFRSSFFNQIRKLLTIGKNIQLIVIVDHFSPHGHGGCAAYEEDDSRERHERNLRQSYELVKAEPGFEDFPVQLFLHDINTNQVYEVTLVMAQEKVAV